MNKIATFLSETGWQTGRPCSSRYARVATYERPHLLPAAAPSARNR